MIQNSAKINVDKLFASDSEQFIANFQLLVESMQSGISNRAKIDSAMLLSTPKSKQT